MIKRQSHNTPHPIFWWNMKILCGLLLIASVFARYLVDSINPLFVIPDFMGQALVVIGGAIFLYHYLLLKRHNRYLFKPNTLITGKGLFKYVRHPMYLADMIMYLGFVLIMPHWITIAIFAIGLIALYKQAEVEDRFMAKLFATEHQEWAKTTRLIFPG